MAHIREGANEEENVETSEHTDLVFTGKSSDLLNIKGLRQKFKWIKTRWAKLRKRAISKSGKNAKKMPHWYTTINPGFNDTEVSLHIRDNAELSDSSSNSYSEAEDEEM